MGQRGFWLRYKGTLNVAAVDPLYPNMFAPRKLATIKLKRSIARKMSPKTTCWSSDGGGRGGAGDWKREAVRSKIGSYSFKMKPSKIVRQPA